MSRVHCRFCSHPNPSGSRFCNECGSPLNLRPCPQCEAVNDDRERKCHLCGADFPRAVDDQGLGVDQEILPAPVGPADPSRPHVPEVLATSLGSPAERAGAGSRAAVPLAVETTTLSSPAAAADESAGFAPNHGVAVLGPRRRVQPAVLAALLALVIAAFGYVASLPAGALDPLLERVAHRVRSLTGATASTESGQPLSPAREATAAAAPAANAEPAEPKSAEPKSAEPKSAEPKSAEPKSAEPKSADASVTGTGEPGSRMAAPAAAEPKAAAVSESKTAAVSESKAGGPPAAEPNDALPERVSTIETAAERAGDADSAGAAGAARPGKPTGSGRATATRIPARPPSGARFQAGEAVAPFNLPLPPAAAPRRSETCTHAVAALNLCEPDRSQ